jgi:hypothetical protein
VSGESPEIGAGWARPRPRRPRRGPTRTRAHSGRMIRPDLSEGLVVVVVVAAAAAAAIYGLG